MPLHAQLPSQPACPPRPLSAPPFLPSLSPQLVYQAEPLVDILVKAKAHHYLEFKRVEGSFTLAPPAASAKSPAPLLQPVPASKSDVFKDRSLSISEKRALMGFLQAAVESVQGGQGRLGVSCEGFGVSQGSSSSSILY